MIFTVTGDGSGGLSGGSGNMQDGNTWILRDLYLPPASGFYAGRIPDYPADFAFPWEPANSGEPRREMVMGVSYFLNSTLNLSTASTKRFVFAASSISSLRFSIRRFIFRRIKRPLPTAISSDTAPAIRAAIIWGLLARELMRRQGQCKT